MHKAHSVIRPRAIVVLGAAQYDGVPSRALRARLDHAVTLSQRYPDAEVITVGAKLPGDRFTEAEVGERYLRDHGVPAARITALHDGWDTSGSLDAVAAHLGPARSRLVLVVTDPLHTVRVEFLARLRLVDLPVVQASGAPGCPQRFPHANWWRAAAHEAGGLAVLAVEAIAGKRASHVLRCGLHRIEAWMRPTRKAHHAEIQRQRRAQES
ncbi:YdcF family protein [Corynebacterium massiliense]|uniref:DUF218 domain-containing protein n=1 Tax=Corynebacterium massiliense DSM 45435 TaxID=1121364 RepID=A0ABY7U8B7_9CORY|nr:YdcF family protein [Corynebacterium massiliense]WCZ32946.1 hypothetical protein CMASS_07580 [Corynebacterium massiliense DSM 45435]